MQLNKSNSSFLAELIKNTNGRFFGVTFLKKDGSLRYMNARLGVKKHLKRDHTNDVNSAEPSKNIVVYDRNVKGYRSINPERILSLRVNGVDMKIRDASTIFANVAE